MSNSLHNPSILLKRTLSLTEPSSFILCMDSVVQTSHRLVHEVLDHITGSGEPNIIYISFEGANIMDYATTYIDVNQIGFAKVVEAVQSLLPDPKSPSKGKNLIIVDSLNHISKLHIAQFISSIAATNCTLLATFHKDLPENYQNTLDNYPSSETLLQFMATSIFDIEPILPKTINDEDLRFNIDRFHIPRGLNNPKFEVTFTNRRRSGRSLTYKMTIDTKTHSYELSNEEPEENELETPEMLQGLATFNLSTSTKQKEAKDQVALPFLEAQSFAPGSTAIVYEYEKDDDYDEEDPYEDPF